MKRPRPLPQPLTDGGFFSRREAADGEVDANRLRAADVQRPYRGVQATRAPRTLLERCLAYSKRMRPGDVFSHLTAIALHGLPVPAGADRRTAIDVACVHPTAAPATKGVVGHRLRSTPPSCLVQGLPVCEAVEAWCQIAGDVELPDLVAVADELLSRADDLEDARARLVGAIDVPGRYRTAPLRRALRLARVGSRSPQESRLRVILVLGGIPEPALNERIEGRDGRLLGHGDLVWREQRVVGEYEGDQHRTDQDQWNHDVRRYDDFSDAGWTVIRVPKESLRPEHRSAMVARFRRALGLAAV